MAKTGLGHLSTEQTSPSRNISQLQPLSPFLSSPACFRYLCRRCRGRLGLPDARVRSPLSLKSPHHSCIPRLGRELSMFLQVRMQAARSIAELFGRVAWDRTLSAGVIIGMDARSFAYRTPAGRRHSDGGPTHCETSRWNCCQESALLCAF